MTHSWLVLTPPIIVLLIAFITKKLNPALVIGIICSALIAKDFGIIEGGKLAGISLWNEITSIDTLLFYAFLAMLGTVVALVGRSGGAAAFARVIGKKLQNKKMAETASVYLSFSLFIDDYLSNTTVGYVMRPLTDKFKVARAKLAFLVHSIATPLVVLAPISGWSAMITSRLGQAGISQATEQNLQVSANPFLVYLKSIPFIFYSFLMLASVWFIVRRRISYGPMHHHESIAEKTGNLLGGQKDTAQSIDGEEPVKGTLADLFFPLAIFVGSIVTTTLFSKKLVALVNIKANASMFALFAAGLISLVSGFAFSVWRKRLTIKNIPSVIYKGIQLMLDAIIMLFLAATLGSIIRDYLHTGHYLADLMTGNISLTLIPLMLFIVSAAIAIATGTSWGTIAIMAPITVPMVTKLAQVATPANLASVALILPAIGAMLSGAVCGDHISPVSETTIMAANSSGSNPIDHATTQFFYALPSVLCSLLAFWLSGLLIGYGTLISSLFSGGISLIICLVTLQLLNQAKKA